MKSYTGIGARLTPNEILRRMRVYALTLARLDFNLRSGGADGADTAFEVGCDRDNGSKEIFLPWKGFNNNTSPLFTPPLEAFEIAADVYGSSWQYIKTTTKKFMARNIQQVLGKNLDDPSLFVLCWTNDGCLTREQRSKKTGGTGQAIACASERNIPVFNLQREGEETRFLTFLQETIDDV